jgi:hypothetical protein
LPSGLEDPLGELALDLPGSPVILESKAPDQLSCFLRDARPPGPASGKSSPEEEKALAVPADHGLGLDDDKDFLPAKPKLVKCDPEGAVQGGESRFGSPLGVGGKLLAKGQLDGRLLPATSEQGENTAKQ